jgi:hypothetical protein
VIGHRSHEIEQTIEKMIDFHSLEHASSEKPLLNLLWKHHSFFEVAPGNQPRV